MMSFFRSGRYFALILNLLQVCVSQKFIFKDPVILNTTSVSTGQSDIWSVQGDVELTTTDQILFKPTVTFQTCNQVCDVDLTKCGQDAVRTEQGCYCTEKVGDMHKIHVASPAHAAQSASSLTATIMSHDTFQPIAGMTVVGTLPKMTESSSIGVATYRIGEGEAKQLHKTQNLTVCADKIVKLEICLANRKPGTVLKLSHLHGNPLLSDGVCIDKTATFKHDNPPDDKLVFSYLESIGAAEVVLATIGIKVSQDCHLPTSAVPSTDSSILVTKALSTVSKNMQSLKNELVIIAGLMNNSVSKLHILGQDHNQLKHQVESVVDNHKQITTTVQDISSILKASLGEIVHCSRGNGCKAGLAASHGYQCYRFEQNDKVNFTEAVARCQSVGGFLAEIATTEDLNYVKNIASTIKGNFWLGASDKDHEGVWKWVTSGNNVTVSDWAKGQPDNCCEGQHYLLIYQHFNYMWDDAQHYMHFGYICQKNAHNCDGWM